MNAGIAIWQRREKAISPSVLVQAVLCRSRQNENPARVGTPAGLSPQVVSRQLEPSAHSLNYFRENWFLMRSVNPLCRPQPGTRPAAVSCRICR